MNTTCTNFERCGGDHGYCSACVEALLQDERERCARVAEAGPGPAEIAARIRELRTED